jgi:hypothetical protein
MIFCDVNANILVNPPKAEDGLTRFFCEIPFQKTALEKKIFVRTQ